MEKGELHSINGWYVPENALAKQNYQVQNMELVYSYGLIRGNDHYIDDIEYLYDVETMQEITKKDRQRRAILTGELIGGGDYEQPKVPLYEITNLYQKLKKEGASQEEIIQYILNYYDAVSLDDQISKKYPNRYKITPKIKKKALISIN